MKKQLLTVLGLILGFSCFGQTYLTLKDYQDQSITSGGWQSFVVTSTPGSYDWTTSDLGSAGNYYGKATGWNGSGADDTEIWMVSESFDLGTAVTPALTFKNATNYSGPALALKISTDYDGTSDPSTQGTWTDITSSSAWSTGGFNWANSGTISLLTYNGNNSVHVAFVYTSNPTDGAATWQVDDVKVAEPTPAPPVSIYDIQSTGSYDGQEVTTGGIVTGVFDMGSNTGYFIQAGTGVYSGIYVNDASNVPSRGDSLVIEGTVAEVFGNTQIESITSYMVVSSGNAEPATTNISTSDVNLEDYEGVKITVSTATCLEANLGFGEWSVNDGSDTCLVDDLMYGFSPLQGNDYDVTGPVYFSYGAAKIEPRDANDIVGEGLTHTIYNIQYTTDPGGVSPFNGSDVTVNGIVVAESSQAFNSNDRGYWIQDGSGAWHGIFVHDTVNTVVLGDSVEVSANVNENFSQTILRNVSNVTVISSGNTIPDAAVITSDQANTEEYEGVLVTVQNATCISADLGFGQWSINNATQDALVDDVMYEYVPVANETYSVTGVVYYSYNEYKILPRFSPDVTTVAGINELSVNQLDAHPNPSNGTIFIDNNGELINVYNTLGMKVLTTTQSSIELSEGTYFIQVGNKTAKVVVL